MRAYFLLLPVLLFLISCSGKAPTKASFNFEVSNHNLDSGGGLVIFGKEEKGDMFTRIVSSTTIQMELPKGTWSFGGIAWSGTTGNMTGDIRCDNKTLTISSDEATVNLTLENSKCFASGFAVEPGETGALLSASDIVTEFCKRDVSSQIGSPCNYDTATVPSSNDRAFIGSYRISIPGGATFTKVSSEILETACFKAGEANDVSATTALSDLNIPAFAASLGVPLHIDTYLGDACQAAEGMIRSSFGDPTKAKFYYTGSSIKKLYVSVTPEQICSESDRLSKTGFASGFGDANFPFVICNPTQLHFFQRNYSQAAYVGKSFVLGRDIDLSVSYGAGLTPGDPCLKAENSFVPIGTNYTPGVCTFNSDPSIFYGVFDGDGRTISNFRFNQEKTNYIGFFAESNGYISNLTFKNSETESNDYVGIVVGNGTGGALFNIHVKNSNVRGRSNVGAIAGYFQGGGMSLLHASGIEVEGETQYIGGLIGYAGSTISSVSFNGQVYSSQGPEVGGITGHAQAPIYEAVSSGVIHNHGAKTGGIAGKAGTGAVIEQSRSDMYIPDFNPSMKPRQIGGIVGESADSVTKSLFYGYIKSTCTGTSPDCNIGGISGSGISAPSSFSTQATGFTGTGTAGSSTFNLAGLRSTVNITNAANLCNGGCSWTQVLGDIPRLPFESGHPCTDSLSNALVPAQITALRGDTTSNPIVICHPGQMAGLNNAASKHYVLRSNINLSQSAFDDYGIFSGIFDGKEHYLFGHFNTSATPTALFAQVTGSISNLRLTGIKTGNFTSCGGCDKAGLTLINNGTLSNISVSDIDISVLDDNSILGGIAAINTGTIQRSRMYGNLSNTKMVGGIAGQNSGTINDCSVEMNFSGIGTEDMSYIGGIAALNSGSVLRNRFRGEMIFTNSLTLDRVGGIVGSHENLGSTPVVRDNLTSGESLIVLNAATNSNAAGIVGFSDSSSNVISRNINQAFVDETGPDDASINPIAKAGDFVETNGLNYAASVTYDLIAQNDAPTGVVHAGNTCTVNIPTSTPRTTIAGAIRKSNDTYFGSLTHTGSGNYQFAFASDISTCTGLNSLSAGMVNVFEARSVVANPTLADLKSQNYDVVDMTVTTDMRRLFSAYFEYFTTGNPSNPPVWIVNDPLDFNEDRFDLFGIH